MTISVSFAAFNKSKNAGGHGQDADLALHHPAGDDDPGDRQTKLQRRQNCHSGRSANGPDVQYPRVRRDGGAGQNAANSSTFSGDEL